MGDVALLIPGQRFARNLKPVVPRVELTSCSKVPPDRSRVEPVQCRIDSRSRLVSAVIALSPLRDLSHNFLQRRRFTNRF